MTPRRILYQLVAPLGATVGPHEPRRRQEILAANARPGVTVDVRSAYRGRDGIEGAWDAVEAAPAIVEGVRAAEREGFDAAIIGCFSDPAVDAAREAVSIPVVGAGAASIHLALQLGDRLGVLAPGGGTGSGRTLAHFRAMGQETRLAGVRGVGLAVSDMARAASDGTLAAAHARIAEPARALVETDGADVLLLGCMSMAFLDPTKAIAERAGVPTVNPVLAALAATETMIALGLTHSRLRWPKADDRPVVTLAGDEDGTLPHMEATR